MRKTPVICLHGFPGSRGDWNPLSQQLADQEILVPLSMPWSTEYAPHTEIDNLNMADILHHVASQISGTCDAPAPVVAHDLGGGAAWWLAAIAPKLVKNLAVISTPHPTAYRESLDQLTAKGFREYIDLILRDKRDEPLPELYLGEPLTVDQNMEERLTANFRSTRPNALRALYQSSLTREAIVSSPVFPSLKVPVCIIHGELDPYFDTAIFQRSSELCGSKTRLETISGGGHFVHMTHSKRTAAALTEFWADAEKEAI